MTSTVTAIDPGYCRSAVVQWDGNRILAMYEDDNEVILRCLSQLNIVPSAHVLVIEGMQSFGMPVGREVFETVFWVGRFYEAWFQHQASLPKVIYRRQIKVWHCNNASAKDANIRASLIGKYGPPGTKKAPGLTYGLKGDLWSAFAIATYWTETHRTETMRTVNEDEDSDSKELLMI